MRIFILLVSLICLSIFFVIPVFAGNPCAFLPKMINTEEYDRYLFIIDIYQAVVYVVLSIGILSLVHKKIFPLKKKIDAFIFLFFSFFSFLIDKILSSFLFESNTLFHLSNFLIQAAIIFSQILANVIFGVIILILIDSGKKNIRYFFSICICLFLLFVLSEKTMEFYTMIFPFIGQMTKPSCNNF